MNAIPIVPAIIPKSKQEVIELSDALLFSREFHLDLVDGNFVSSKSWPFGTNDEPLQVKSFLDRYTLEVDLMVADPITVAKDWIMAGADMLVFHIETIDLASLINYMDQNTKVSFGVSAHGDTPLETLIKYAIEADYIQLMGIKEIGAQGLPFDEEVIEKIAVLKKEFPFKSITVDGSVNSDTIARLAKAGADRFIVGSAIVGQSDPAKAHAKLSELING
jgi:ribulose-phosphate 3-epimerase